MSKRSYLVAMAASLLVVSVALAQEFPVMNMVADKVIQKYQHANCEQLWAHKGKPKTDEEKNLIQMLRGDPQMRTAFINKVAAPIANKMFECGMLP